MNKGFILFFLLLSSCAMGDDIQCLFVTNELCVDPGGYSIDTEMIYDMVNITEAAVNKFYPGLNLPDLIKENDVKMKYISKQEMIENHSENVRGVYYRNGKAIYIVYPNFWDNEVVLCLENYYVPGHELLHFIFEEYLGGSEDDGFNHNSDLFVQWSDNNEASYISTAEYYIYTDIDNLCKIQGE